jgi:hypothetical protein
MSPKPVATQRARFGLLGWKVTQSRHQSQPQKTAQSLVVTRQALSCLVAVEKSAEGRRLRVATPKMQNPAQKPGPKKCMWLRSRPRLRKSASRSMANKIRNYPNMISGESKEIFFNVAKTHEFACLPNL